MHDPRSTDGLEFSIVVPAHDEAAGIEDLLRSLSPLADRAQVVVVANGCTDGTADLARRSAPWADVVELDHGSKPCALNCGDDHATLFPRAYLDADVRVSADDLLAMARELAASGCLAVAPTPFHDTSASSRLVRSHYRIWERMSTNREGLGGASPQLVTQEGRARFDRWPDVIGDDYFLDGLFEREEVRRLHDVRVARRAPVGARDCMSRKARIHAGNVAVSARGLRPQHEGGGARGALRVVLSEPARLVDLPAHLLITVGSRVVYRWRRRRGHDHVFFRDRSREI